MPVTRLILLDQLLQTATPPEFKHRQNKEMHN